MKELNWVHKEFDFSRFDTEWLCYVSYNVGAISTTYIGIVLGYNESGLIAHSTFKYVETEKVHMVRRLYSGFLGLHHVLTNFHGLLGRSRIFINSKKVADWFNHQVNWKKNSLWTKKDLEVLIPLLNPVVTSFDFSLFPTCAIREMALGELLFHRYRTGTYQSFADLNEPEV